MIAFILTFLAGALAGWIVGSGNIESVRRWIYAAAATVAATAVAAWEYIQQLLN
jgi:hypothetical protein